MGLTLAEKRFDNRIYDQAPICDLEIPKQAEGHVDTEEVVALGPLLIAAAVVILATLLVWVSAGPLCQALGRLVSRLVPKRYRHHPAGSGADERDDSDGGASPGGLHGSPPTPPPVEWLRDSGSASPSFMTPVTEPLLFSVSPLQLQQQQQQQQQQLANGGRDGGGGAHRSTAQQHPHRRQRAVAAEPYGQHTVQGRKPANAAPPSTVTNPFVPRHTLARTPCEGPGAGGSWGRELLARQAALLPAIASVEGLTADPAFQEYIRADRGRSPALAREQALAKVHLYKELRRLDPDGFRRLLTRTDIKSYDVQRPSLVLALFEYLLFAVLVPCAALAVACGAVAVGSPVLRYGPIVLWALLRLQLAANGHTSPLGRALGLYLVYDTPGYDSSALGCHEGEDEPSGGGSSCSSGGGGDGGGRHRRRRYGSTSGGYEYLGNAWEGMPGLGGHLLLVVFELFMALLSCGVLAAGSLASICRGQMRQSLAMRLLGLRWEREVARQMQLSPFAPVSDGAGFTSSGTFVPYRSSCRSTRYGLALS